MHDRVRGVRPRGELRERGEQQPTHRRIREWFLQQSLQGHVDHPVAPQRVIAKVLCCRRKRLRRRTAFQVGERSVEALPPGDAPDRFGRGNKGLREGRAGENSGQGCAAQGHGRYFPL